MLFLLSHLISFPNKIQKHTLRTLLTKSNTLSIKVASFNIIFDKQLSIKMQLSSILLLVIHAAGVLSAPSTTDESFAPDFANSSIPPPGPEWENYIDSAVSAE
ncbi:hypothetical protein ONS95_004559 [Cadophora gregata]|uniref:uncharacterized protein n=1 Tax=Cadophora gregata TaxID=51156 RepID=UPI0026DCC6FE|nr:uncharacterized protein ONS95_004559 [Cadophora gregata]KAK0106054.1 hypothetical protein ONS95_004559 [Cadophora gregata]